MLVAELGGEDVEGVLEVGSLAQARRQLRVALRPADELVAQAPHEDEHASHASQLAPLVCEALRQVRHHGRVAAGHGHADEQREARQVLGVLGEEGGLARIEAECAQGCGHIDAPGEQGLVSEKALEQRVLCHGAINDPKKHQMRQAHGRVRGARHGDREPASVVL